ncbi:hypothetical protein N7465_000203 [Penicillium sp. CMV-2018d]|nr:hypothetical protein N7465_000203 [Penicillium sp. CMV-2018d]
MNGRYEIHHKLGYEELFDCAACEGQGSKSVGLVEDHDRRLVTIARAAKPITCRKAFWWKSLQ